MRLNSLTGLTLISAVVAGVAVAAPAAAAVSDRPDMTASFNDTVRTVLTTDGVTYVGGDFTAANTPSGPVARPGVAAVDATTGQLLPFNPEVNGPVWSLAVDGSDVYLGGSFTTVGGLTRRNIAEVDVTGTPTSWRPRMTSRVRALEVTNGTLYAGGQFLKVSGVPRSRLAAFDTSTGKLTDWNPSPDKPVFDLLAAPGRLYVAGAFDSIDQLTDAGSLAALDPTTGAVQSWNPRIGYPVRALAADGSRVYAAATGAGGHLRAFSVASGADIWAVTADGDFQAVTLVGDTVYFGGHMDQVCHSGRTGATGVCLDGYDSRHKIGAVSAADGALLPFDPQASGRFLGVLDLDSSAGRVAAGGMFHKFLGGTVPQPYFASFS